MRKKSLKKLQLNKETINQMNLASATGGGATDEDCWISRGFTNCTFCNGRTLWQDCTEV